MLSAQGAVEQAKCDILYENKYNMDIRNKTFKLSKIELIKENEDVYLTRENAMVTKQRYKN